MPDNLRHRWQARRRAPLVALLLANLLLLGLVPAGATASALAALAPIETAPGDLITLRASGEEAATFIPPPAELDGPRLASTQFAVTYDGFTPQAQAAFQYAVDIWSAQLTSPVTIRVQAHWTPLDTGVLGQAGASYTTRNFSGAPVANTWYPAALANKLAGTDLFPSNDDITAYFNSDYASSWYFGTGSTPAGKLNFASVVLHELGHGLGFAGTMSVSSGQGRWGSGSSPIVYDRFAVDSSNRSLINTAIYPNPSSALGSALQSGAVRFSGPNATAAAGGTAPRLYAPSSWQSGSSFSHLDEATYPAGNANALMTPAIANGETIYAPGPIALGVLTDLGWNTSAPPSPSPSPSLSPSPSPSQQAQLTLVGGNMQRSPAGTGSGPFTYSLGTTVTLTPQTPGGQTFTGWTVDGAPRGWDTPLTLTMNGNHTVQANFAPTTTFSDVGSDRADYAAIVALASRRTIRGYADGSYGPDDGVQRAQMAALIARATSAGPGTPPTTLTPPNCVVAGSWDCEVWGTGFQDQGGLDPSLWRNVGTLQHYGVAFGYDGTACDDRGVSSPCYGPTEAVSYAQTITFITRMMKAKGYWVAQPNAPLPYSGVPAPHAEDIRTFAYYTGGVPALPDDWNAGATRGWFAQALWAALNDYWGTDAPGNGGYVP
ncbi:MAG: S-layer homology domain-containing protein [Chloroflexia bacterium]